MKRLFLSLFFLVAVVHVKGQTCDEMITFVKEESVGVTYSSYTSKAISKVTFYDMVIDYKTYYFAIVCFKKQYGYGCNEYIYQVGSNTKFNYSLHYLNSAGKAFWKYIQPYNKSLECGASFNN
ncbi:hypothetical protein [Winogradskyella sp.]|uniref:hypothetical protein n=1 Tax=Winogradskyella sp. TaxID=1883156 RepID=UPI003AB68DA2